MENSVKRAGLMGCIVTGIVVWMMVCFPVPHYKLPKGVASAFCRTVKDGFAGPLAIEQARNKKQLEEILGEEPGKPNLEAREKVRRNVVADFVFIPGYTAMFFALMWLLKNGKTRTLCMLGIALAATVATSDVLENLWLLKILHEIAGLNVTRNLQCLKLFYFMKWGSTFLLIGFTSVLFFRAKKGIRPFAWLYILTAVVGFGGLICVALMVPAYLLMGGGILLVGIVFSLFPSAVMPDSHANSSKTEGPSKPTDLALSGEDGGGKQNDSCEQPKTGAEESKNCAASRFEECFKNVVFKQELVEIKARQGNAEPASGKFKRTTVKNKTVGEPSVDLGLVGLALSGGGIRSATFCLGAIQALTKNGLFPLVDYLSSVSGGGYIGTCLSSLLKTGKEKIQWGKFPFEHTPGKQEPEAIRHLRNSGNYLAPSGLLDRLRMAGILLRGIFLNFILLLPYLIVAAWLTVAIHGNWLRQATYGPIGNWSDYYCFTPWIGGVFLLWTLLFPMFQTFTKGNIGTRNAYERSFGILLLATILVLFTESILPSFLWMKSFRGSFNLQKLFGYLTGILSASSFLFTGKAASKSSRLITTVGAYVLGIVGPLVLYVIYLNLLGLFVFGFGNGIEWWLFAFILAFFYYTRRFIDVNAFSMHGFYRDRLSKAYLFDVIEGKVVGNDEIRMSDLSQPDSAAPFHLVNATINLQGSKDMNLRGRMSDFFFFSKNHCGGLRTGFVETRELEDADRHFDLGTAMAISGAAASANMGTITIRPLIFLLTLLNVRLGYWLPNPLRFKKSFLNWILSKSGVGPICLLKELFGLVNEKGSHVNLSDGGHLENLGIYELLRRRCKYIIAIDGEADPKLNFGSLAKLIRYARIDMSYDIDIDLEDVRLHEDGFSRKHCAMGKIYYDDGQTGYLLYIKSSVTGDENEYIQEYKREFPDFPHQTTADQFFDEAQFEVYRALGYHIADELFEERFAEKGIEDRYDTKGKPIEEWFDDLYMALQPRFKMAEEFVELQPEINAIDAQFEDPQLSAYLSQNFPEILENDTQTGKVFNVCKQQLGFMQDAYIKLQLDQLLCREHYFNRGWMNLFRRWAQSPDFRRVWAISIGTYSLGFQRFCEEALKIRWEIEWEYQEKSMIANSLTKREQYYLNKEEIAAGQAFDVWVPKMVMNLTAGSIGFGSDPRKRDQSIQRQEIPIGFAAIKVSSSVALLRSYRIRDHYRQMRLMDKMIPALREALSEHYEAPTTASVLLTKEEMRYYGAFFKRYRFELQERWPKTAGS